MNPSRIASVAAASLVIAMLAALAGCDSRDYRNDPVISEARDVSGFDAIELNGTAQLDVHVGESANVTIRGQARVIQDTSMEVQAGTLQIRTSRKALGWNLKNGRVTIVVSVPHLKSLRLQGGNDVRLTGFSGGASRIHVEGAARVQASGKLDELHVDMQGAGVADLSDLAVQDARVTVEGVGQVIVNAQDSLDATMNGIGAIFYEGSPHSVNTRMNGIGTISQRGHDSPNGSCAWSSVSWRKNDVGTITDLMQRPKPRPTDQRWTRTSFSRSGTIAHRPGSCR